MLRLAVAPERPGHGRRPATASESQSPRPTAPVPVRTWQVGVVAVVEERLAGVVGPAVLTTLATAEDGMSSWARRCMLKLSYPRPSRGFCFASSSAYRAATGRGDVRPRPRIRTSRERPSSRPGDPSSRGGGAGVRSAVASSPTNTATAEPRASQTTGPGDASARAGAATAGRGRRERRSRRDPRATRPGRPRGTGSRRTPGEDRRSPGASAPGPATARAGRRAAPGSRSRRTSSGSRRWTAGVGTARRRRGARGCSARARRRPGSPGAPGRRRSGPPRRSPGRGLGRELERPAGTTAQRRTGGTATAG